MKHTQAVCCRISAILLISVLSLAKDQPSQVIVWPESGTPVVRFTFGKFKEVGSIATQHTYVVDTTAENLWNKKISHAGFTLYLFDKNKVRIAEAYMTISDAPPGQAVKFQTTLSSSGPPASMQLVASSLPAELGPVAPAHKVTVTVNSVPQGATIKVDGNDEGATPKMIALGIGKHVLEFSKEGFNTGHFPLEVGANDVSGGSVSYELGSAAHDTIELRDGTVLSGDLESVSAMDVVVRMGGALQHMNRNQVKRIILVERDPPSQ
jgi:hypothetical protein